MKIIPTLAFISIGFLSNCGNDSTSTITNTENPVATSVQIGTQIWMNKNLNVTTYRNGDTIRFAPTYEAWEDAFYRQQGAWRYPNNDSANAKTYGRLYNWAAVNDPRGLAPVGWHVPSDSEWTVLENFAGTNAGGKLKAKGTIEAGTGLWISPNEGATDQFGFSVLPAGMYVTDGSLQPTRDQASFWTSTASDWNNAWFRSFFTRISTIERLAGMKEGGLSVRCVKDK